MIIFLIILLVSFLIYNNLKINKIFLIKKDNHYSNKLFFRVYLLFKPRTFNYKVNFISDITYDIGVENQLDTNKLIGIGFLPGHHVNSIRFGYRYNPIKDKVEIYAYSYVNKERIIKEDEILAECPMNQEYNLTLQITDLEYRLSINDKNVSVIKKSHDNKIAYLLKPYFGGNIAAPKDFKIKIESLP